MPASQRDSQRGRLFQFIEYLGISRNDFERSIGMSEGSVSRNSTRLGERTLERVYLTYPRLNILWLLFGRGSMILPNNLTNQDIVIGDSVSAEALLGDISVIGKEMLVSENKDLKHQNELLQTKLTAAEEMNTMLRKHILLLERQNEKVAL